MKHGEENGFKEMKLFLKENEYFKKMVSLINEYSAGLPRLVDMIKGFLISLGKNQLAQYQESKIFF